MIPPETVTRVWQRMSVMPVEQGPALVKLMSKEQPWVLAYLLATSEDEVFDQDEAEVFLYIGMTIWQIMKAGVKSLKKITDKQLDRAEKDNEDLLEKMASDSAGDFVSAAGSMVENYPEPEVLRYLTAALMEDEEGNPDNPPISVESLGIAFLHLKIVLDAFVGTAK